MAVKINVRGAGAGSKPAARKSTAAKNTGTKATTKRSTAKPAASKAATTKRGAKAKTAQLPTRRSTAATTDDRTMKKLLTAVQKAGDRRYKAKQEHEAAVDSLYEAAKAALDGGVPMARVSESSGISRQWLYKMGEFAGRTNGDSTAPAPKATTRPTTRSTKRSSSKSSESKTSKSTGRTRARIKVK